MCINAHCACAYCTRQLPAAYSPFAVLGALRVYTHARRSSHYLSVKKYTSPQKVPPLTTRTPPSKTHTTSQTTPPLRQKRHPSRETCTTSMSQNHHLLSHSLINPRRACAARVTVVVLSVCLSVCPREFSRTTGYEAANEWHQRVVNNEKMDINVAIFSKQLRSRDMA